MDTTIPVSVIIPTKRRNDYVKRAINSVVSQNYPSLEICIVDNNDNPDLSAELKDIITKYEQKYSSFRWMYVHSSQKHASGTKNDGIHAVSSKYICFLDDDDELLPGSIAIRAKEMFADNDLALLYCAGFSKIFPYPFKIYRYYHHYQDNEVLKMMSCSSMFINKEIFKTNAILFDATLSRLEDYDMGRTIIARGMKIKSIPEALVILHQHPHERMSTYTPFKMDFRDILVSKWKESAEEYVYHYVAGHYVWRRCFNIERKKYSDIKENLMVDFNKAPSSIFKRKYQLVAFSPLLFLALYHCSLVLWQFYQNRVYPVFKKS